MHRVINRTDSDSSSSSRFENASILPPEKDKVLENKSISSHEKCKIVGESKIFDLITNQEIPVIIKKTKPSLSKKKYDVYLMENQDKSLGEITIKWLSKKPPVNKLKNMIDELYTKEKKYVR